MSYIKITLYGKQIDKNGVNKRHKQTNLTRAKYISLICGGQALIANVSY